MKGWIETLVKLGGALGMNPVKLRWRLLRVEQSCERWRSRTGERVAHVQYRHRVCASCRAINHRDERRCTSCGAKLGSRAGEVLERIGLGMPEALSVSALLSAAIVLVYLRLVLAQGGSWMGFGPRVLHDFGWNWLPSLLAGEWWRLGTAIFLHGGIFHIGFNLMALNQIGPPVEHLFGRGRTLLLFMVTGLVASLGSSFLGFILRGAPVPSVGASGAVLGLIGAGAGWGHRDGTSIGRGVRNQLLKWAAYTLVFGLVMPGIDNTAHVVGFLTGALLGLVLEPARPGVRRRDASLGVVGALLALAAWGLALFPPASW